MKKVFLSGVLFLVFFFMNGSSGDEGWVDLTRNLADTRFSAMEEFKNGSILVGTSDGLYIKRGDEDKWEKIFICRGEYRGINHIFIDNANTIYIATMNGLYKSNNFGLAWTRVFRGMEEENNCIFIIPDYCNSETLYLGTAKGLFWTKNGCKTWQRVRGIMGTGKITSIAVEKKDDNASKLFVICNNEVYRAGKDLKSYIKIFGSELPEDQSEEPLESEENPEDEILFYLNDIIESGHILYLATNKGLFISEDYGVSWKRFSAAGLSNRHINHVCVRDPSPKEIFVGTKKGVFKFIKEKEKWTGLYYGMESVYVEKLMISYDGKHLWALCNNRIYTAKLSSLADSSFEEPDTKNILSRFEKEPTINEVQAMAIDYAEVYPDKITKWRQGAKFKALLPKISLSVDRSASDTYEIYTSTTTSYWFSGPSDKSEGWGINFSWDLADLVWNESQTSIDVRSKLMVQLRDDIVDEVTRLYFERRRCQIELVTNPPTNMRTKLEKTLRIQELTACLDGLTGGAFSASIEE